MEVKNLIKTYKTEYELVQALNNMSIKFPDHGMVFIVGVSGSGKSTLMNMLSGVDVPTSGEVIINGKSLFSENKSELFGYRNSYIGLIFQDYNLIEDMNVYDNIKLPLELLDIKDYSIIDEIIKKVDIEDIKYANINEISSGQMQRVAIARALVKNSGVILADEPTGNLDSKNTKIVMDLLKEISKDRLVIVITHDDEAAHEYGDRIIEIEDGKVLSDRIEDASINEIIEKEQIPFKEPKVKFSKQLVFTKNFIFSNIGRSLAILLLMILIPFIGNILCGYLFFNIDTSFIRYQKEYGCEYIKLADEYTGYQVNYNDDAINDLYDKYQGSNLIEVYSINYYILNSYERKKDDLNSFYKNEVNNLIVDSGTFTYLDGESPYDERSVAITDYFQASYEYYTDRFIDIDDYIEINGVRFNICGIIDTTYENFIDYDQTDLFTSMAFQENLEYYNAFYVTEDGIYDWYHNMTYYEEVGKFTINNSVVPKTKYESILVRKYSPTYVLNIQGNSTVQSGNGLVSYDLWTKLLEKDPHIYNSVVSFVCSEKTKYNFGTRVGGMYSSNDTNFKNKTQYELIVDSSTFMKYLEKQMNCKFLISSNDRNFKEILMNENVVNQSFSFAKEVLKKSQSSHYVMIQFLLAMILITMVFAYVVNSITMNNEKKKIGIKYSFGIKKKDIVIPYVLELVIYIILGLVISLLLTKVVYPLITNGLIYTTSQEIKENYFFYIGWSSIIGWDALIYIIMLVSLLIMVYKICKKSPIEIIKDL